MPSAFIKFLLDTRRSLKTIFLHYFPFFEHADRLQDFHRFDNTMTRQF